MCSSACRNSTGFQGYVGTIGCNLSAPELKSLNPNLRLRVLNRKSPTQHPKPEIVSHGPNVDAAYSYAAALYRLLCVVRCHARAHCYHRRRTYNLAELQVIAGLGRRLCHKSEISHLPGLQDPVSTEPGA